MNVSQLARCLQFGHRWPHSNGKCPNCGLGPAEIAELGQVLASRDQELARAREVIDRLEPWIAEATESTKRWDAVCDKVPHRPEHLGRWRQDVGNPMNTTIEDREDRVMSRLYIWHSVDCVSGSYHHDGALLVVADSQNEAIDLADAHRAEMRQAALQRFGDYALWTIGEPDLVATLHTQPEWTVYAHENAGCC